MFGRRGVLLLTLLFMFGAPGAVVGQGLFGFGFPAAPPDRSVGSIFSPPNFYVGWMQSIKSTKLVFEDNGPGVFLGGDHWWRSAGWRVGIEERINITNACGIIVDGCLLLPKNRRGIEIERAQRRVFDVVVSFGSEEETIFDFIPRTESFSRAISWTTTDDWWHAGGMVCWGSSNVFQIVGGGRYEHFSTRFIQPNQTSSLPSSPADRIDITVNSALPFFGLQSGLSGAGNSLNFRLIGFPMVYSSVTHFENGEAGAATRIESRGSFRRGYWWDIVAQFNRNMFPGADVGVFLCWNVVHGTAYLHSELQPNHISAEDDRGTFNRNTITVGGKFSFSFSLPL
jgi:hypothetical protein